MNADALAQALRAAVLGEDFGRTPDALRGGAPLDAFPSLDLAVVAFPAGAAPVWANVLFSRDHPQGVVAAIGSDAGSVLNIAYLADQRDDALVSIAWQPGADWSRLTWQPLHGDGAHRFVAPYPASLLKLMVAVGVGLACDAGLARWDQPWAHGGQTRAVDHWSRAMIEVSCNESTAAMVALLHACALLGGGRHVLHERLHALGLHTLRLDDTQPDGGWGNAAGAGVGRIQMTAWDTVRLLWLLDPRAGKPPWPEAVRGRALLSAAARDRLLGWLHGQQWHHVLGRPADADFAHKTGTTENYASDAGIVAGRAPRRRHYLIALLSSLGSRYAPGAAEGAVDERLRRLGAAVDGVMSGWLEEARP